MHDVEFDDLHIDHDLKDLLSKIDGQKLIYTNASYNHAENILKSMGIFEEFNIIFDIKGTNAIEWGAYGVPESFLINNTKVLQKLFVILKLLWGQLRRK